MSRFWVFFAVLGAVLLVSCGQLGREQQGKITNFRQGTNGLELTLLPNMPPKEILEGSPFRIGVQVQNRGAYDVSRAAVSVVGLNEAWTPLLIHDIELPTLLGRSLDAPEGDFFIAEFPGQNRGLPPGAAEYRSKFWVIAEYDYTSIAQTDVCINPELFVGLERGTGSCTVRNSISLSGQGAPVAVTRVEEIITPGETSATVQFTFTVENRGGGELVSPIRVRDATLANRRMRCSPEEIEPVDLKERRNKVVCITTEPLASPYTTTLSLALDYTYRTKKEGEFVIKQLPRR